jgi:two-component system sensor histidine kinase RegB
MAVAGQSGAILITYFWLGFELPLTLAFVVVAASAWLNVGLRLRYPVNHRLDDGPAAVLLGYDILQLSCLLYLTGGLQNPFALLFLAPVMIAAVSLSMRPIAALLALMVVAATFLAFFHLPLPWYAGKTLEMPLLLVAGVWLALVLGASFVAIYASRVSTEARLLADALSATELVLAREQHLTQLDGIAAAVAHELGTPLATVTVVVKEIQKQLPSNSPLKEDIDLLVQEAQRCRAILGKLSSLGEEQDGMWASHTISHLIEDVVEPIRDFGVTIEIEQTGNDPEPCCRKNPAIQYGLGNLIENAVDFARSKVRIRSEWSPTRVKISIHDDGPGFSQEVLGQLGEPYVSTRRSSTRRAKSEETPGLGLGLFVAKTLLERSGAVMTMTNAPSPATGAWIDIVWPRAEFERDTHRATAA